MKEFLEQEEDCTVHMHCSAGCETFFTFRQAGEISDRQHLVNYKDKVHPV
jgi:hypothetical protein